MSYTPHQMYSGGPECPCPGNRSVYHKWFNEGRTVGMHDQMVGAHTAAIHDQCSPDECEVEALVRRLTDQYAAALVERVRGNNMWNPGDPIPHQHLGSVEACFCDESDSLVCAACGHYHIVGDDDGADGGCGTCECFDWSEPRRGATDAASAPNPPTPTGGG